MERRQLVGRNQESDHCWRLSLLLLDLSLAGLEIFLSAKGWRCFPRKEKSKAEKSCWVLRERQEPLACFKYLLTFTEGTITGSRCCTWRNWVTLCIMTFVTIVFQLSRGAPGLLLLKDHYLWVYIVCLYLKKQTNPKPHHCWCVF